jgi:putative DNA primase/helicase
LIPFTVSFEGRGDERLDEKLDAERTGILAWAVRGAVQWFAGGLPECKCVREATAAYRQESDALGSFLDDCVSKEPGRFTGSAEMFRVYSRWCEANGVEPWKADTFSKALKKRGYEPKKCKGARGYVDLMAMAPEVEE